MQTIVDFLRHGEVSGGSYYRGSTDDPLTEFGWQQMQDTVADQHWDLIISSPLQRCLNFAESLQQQYGMTLLVESAWQEICFGDWEGKTAEQIETQELECFYQDPLNHPPDNAEPMPDFISRINQAWENLLKQHQGKHILVISHAGVIRSLFHCLLELPVKKTFNLQLDHASLTRFKCYHHSPDDFISLVFHNSTAAKIY